MIIEICRVQNPVETTMEAPAPHGGSPGRVWNIATENASRPPQGLLHTPTPIGYDPQALFGILTDENQLEFTRNGSKRRLDGRIIRGRSRSPSRGSETQHRVLKHSRKLSGHGRDVRAPLANISKQLQALTGNVQQALEQQVQDQQQARQSELETVWTLFREELHHRDAQQQARDEQDVR